MAVGQSPYQRRTITFRSVYDRTLKAHLVRTNGIRVDPTPFTSLYEPNDPAADAQGYVYESNVQPMIEAADLREAGRSHEALVKAFEKILQMLQSLLGLLRS